MPPYNPPALLDIMKGRRSVGTLYSQKMASSNAPYKATLQNLHS